MLENKLINDTQLDVSLYIEGLLTTVPDAEREEPVSVVTTDCESMTETLADNDVGDRTGDYSDQQVLSLLEIAKGGKHLLIPANRISFIDRSAHNIVRLPTRNPAFKGIATLRKQSTAIIDLLALLENQQTENRDQVEQYQVNTLVVIEGYPYAIECDSVHDIHALEREAIRWNPSAFKNKLYQGVTVNSLLPLINIDALSDEVMAIPFVNRLQKKSFPTQS